MREPDLYGRFRLPIGHDARLMTAAMGMFAGHPDGVVLGDAEVEAFDGDDVLYRVPMKKYEGVGT